MFTLYQSQYLHSFFHLNENNGIVILLLLEVSYE
jgi:hypothetical protein